MNKKKEPLFRVSKRDDISLPKRILIRIIAILLALLVSALFIYLVTKLDPISVYESMFYGAIGTERRTWILLRDTAFLLLLGVSLTPAFKMKFWNCGAEGQALAGGLVTAALMIYCGDTISTPLLLIIMFIASCLAGGLWALLPGIFKAKFDTNETLFTLMMNYVAIQLVEFYVDIWDKKQSHSVGVINLNTQGGWFPSMLGQQYLLNIIIVVVISVVVAIYLKYSKHGFELTVVGESPATAKYSGINVGRTIIRTTILSGAIAGIAGFIEVAGNSHTISKGVANGQGFTAIIVCWLAKFNTISMALISFLIIFLEMGANQIASDFNLNTYASSVITAIILFFIIGSEFFINYKLVFKKEAK